MFRRMLLRRQRKNSMAKKGSKAAAKNKQNAIPSSFSLRYTLRGHKDIITQIAWSPDGHILASVSQDKTIRLWNGQNGNLLYTLLGHASYVYGVTWSPDGHILASGS